MNQTGVASTGWRRQALRNRLPRVVQWVTLSRFAGEADEIFEPERLEPQLGAELAELGRHRLVEEIVAGDDGDGRRPLIVVRPQPPQEPEAVDQRHAQVEDDRVGVALFRFAQAGFGVHGGPDLIPFEPQHPRKRLGDALVVVDDQDLCGGRSDMTAGTGVL